MRILLLILIQEKAASPRPISSPSILKFSEHGEVGKMRKTLKTEKKSKSKQQIDRYLQYLDWMDKKTIKSWIVPLILKDFSIKYSYSKIKKI